MKVITAVRMITTPKGGYEPLFTIASGGMTYHSKDMCPSEFFDKQVKKKEVKKEVGVVGLVRR